MVELELKDIQQISLKVLKEVSDFCRQYNIRYSLAYGTLLGAIRHKGFIPWDDDVDIIMPRPDYELFLKKFKSNSRLTLSSEYENYLTFSRVCDTKFTRLETLLPFAPLNKGNHELGVWIDIFPIDGVDSNFNVFTSQMEKLHILFESQLQARWLIPFYGIHMGFYSCAKQIVKKIIHFNKDVNQINEQIRTIRGKHDYNESAYVSQIVCGGNGNREFFKAEILENYIDVVFEGYKFKAVKDYDIYLKKNYGDYMQLPPKSERLQHSAGHTHFYWKSNTKINI